MDIPLPVDTSTSSLPPLSPPHPRPSVQPTRTLANSIPPTTTTIANLGPQPMPHNRPLSTTPDALAPGAASRLPPPNALSGPRILILPSSVHTPAAQPSGKWDCNVCQRTLLARERTIHLAGNPHRKRLVAWEATEKQRREKEELARKVAESAELARVAAAPSGFWECTVCERMMMPRSKESHLSGSPHAHNQAQLEAKRQMEKKKVEEEEIRRTEQIRIEEEARREEEKKLEELRRTEQLQIEEEMRQEEERKLEELRRTENIRIEEELRRTEQIRIEEEIREEEEKKLHELRRTEQLRIQDEIRQEVENLEELRRTEQIRIEEELRQKDEKKLEEFRRTEQQRIEEENRRNVEEEEDLRKVKEKQIEHIRIEEEKRRTADQLLVKEQEDSNRVLKAQLDQENAAAADQQLWIAQKQQRKEWMRKQEEETVAAWQLEGQRRIEQEERRKEWVRKQEEEDCAAWRMEEQFRIEEQNRRKRWMRIQDEQATAAWRMEEQLRIEEEKRRKQWEEKQEEETTAAWRVGEHLRQQQEKSRNESMRKLEAAAEHTHAELLRKHAEEEARRTRELERAEERENAQRIAEQVKMEMESRRGGEQQKQQEANRRALEEVELMHNVEAQGGAVLNIATSGSSIESTGQFLPGVPSTQNIPEGADLIDSGSEGGILHYWQQQTLLQEMHRQQLWMQPAIVMTLPMPVMSATDIPPILYRVYDETSVSKYSWEGFTAAACCMPPNAFHFRNMVNLHGNWSSREKTPFISATSSPDAAAWHVAIRQATRNQPNIMVALIDTAALLGQTGIWKMHDARDHFGLQPWKCHPRAFDNEYICTMRIPVKAIIACCRPEYFKQNAMMFLDNLGRRYGTDTGGEGSS